MRALWKILATLIVLPLTYLSVVSVWMLMFGDVSPRNAPSIGALTLAPTVTLLVAIWLPSITRRWLAGIAGGAVVIAGGMLAILAGDLAFSTTYSVAVSSGVKTLGPVIAVILAIQLMRRPRFTH